MKGLYLNLNLVIQSHFSFRLSRHSYIVKRNGGMIAHSSENAVRNLEQTGRRVEFLVKASE
jgi:hypothetical protein